MTTQIQTLVRQPVAKHGKQLPWLWRGVNAAVIVVGIFCGYSLESRHHASAAVMQTAAGQVISPREEPAADFARRNGLHQAMQKLCAPAEPKPDQRAHPKRVTLL